MWNDKQRATRENKKEEDTNTRRSPYQRDRDRILHSSALMRLGGISQVVSANHIEPFHTRLLHTFKVAHIGRRIAENFLLEAEEKAKRGKRGNLERLHHTGFDPDVVEAACLAHDLGHPPFGHIGEKAIEDMVRDYGGDHEGYEGNAQSLRILTK